MIAVQVLSKTELNQWFGAPQEQSSHVQRDERGLFFLHPEANCIDLEYPTKLERLPFLARALATIGYDPSNFEGALLWFTDWGVWNPSDEAAGYRIVEAMNGAAGQSASFEATPGHLFRPDELTDAVAMLLQPMMFGWDAYYLPRWSFGQEEFFVFISHDSFVSIVTRTKAFYKKVFGLLKELGLDPHDGHELQRSRFCRTSFLPSG